MTFLFDRERGLGMAYDHTATLTVEEAYRTRRANCLTFTILTLALARELGLDAQAHHLDEVLSWREENANLVRTDHVNTGVRLQQRRYTIDVASNDILSRASPNPIRDEVLLAMYFSNRAMELVIDGDYLGAAPYMATSLALDPDSADSLSNAGVVALRTGDLPAAERHYRAALARKPDHLGALANLAQLYDRQGQADRAQQLRTRSARVLARDPFHHFMAGHQAEATGDYDTAVDRYRRAVRLHPAEHRFHFALARALLQQGDTRQAIRVLTQARRRADQDSSTLYQAKLDLLRSKAAR
ncbi:MULTISPECIES: tetratricopeptide repeat protein [Luteimonas]|uniref:tetratricopeptide repeat protein n=1 Tax=Luteimonas TaxID=83614 RepID=UPI001304033E|nr:MULTISPECIES: tetratricopeptide repeat protein [Luteimonas]